MAPARLSHSDQHGFALTGETDSNQVHLRVAPVGLGTQNPFESLIAQRLERSAAVLFLETFLGWAIQPAKRAPALVPVYGAEEGANNSLGTESWLLRAAEAQRSNQEAVRARASQVPEQDGANSSSSAADTNSSLHQNDAREWPLRTHWSWSWQSQVSCWLPPGQPPPQFP